MATTAAFNAAYAGTVAGLTVGRSAIPDAAAIVTKATNFANKVVTAAGTPTLTLAGQAVLLASLCQNVIGGRDQGAALPVSLATVIGGAYTTLTAAIAP